MRANYLWTAGHAIDGFIKNIRALAEEPDFPDYLNKL